MFFCIFTIQSSHVQHFELRYSASKVKKIYIKKASEAKYRKRPGPKSKKAQQQSAKFAPVTIEEVDSLLSELLHQWGYDFEPGRHNEYVFYDKNIIMSS